jgi:glycosyltransferase involved in cell wall biosynthesis
MKRRSTISAIIPTYNRSAFLKECVESLLNQSRHIDEIIIVNDGSTDDTATIAQSYGSAVIYLSKSNGGKASALNLALNHCSSDYIWICDDDDIAAADGAAVLASALDTDPFIGLAYGTFKIFQDTSTGRAFSPPTYWHRPDETNVTINFLEEMFTFQFSMLVRRTAYETVGLFDETLLRSQDYDMVLRLLRNVRSTFVPHVIFFQRQHTGARGPASEQFDAHASERKWLHYDQKIFHKIWRNYSLEEFIPTFALSWEKVPARRAALVQRACIFAKRALWDAAISDLEEAAASAGAQKPKKEEVSLAESVVRNNLAWICLIDNDIFVQKLRQIHDMNSFGEGIILAISRPILWQARSLLRAGEIGMATQLIRILHRIVGIQGLAVRAYRSIVT